MAASPLEVSGRVLYGAHFAVWQTGRMGNIANRVFAALPDAVTSAVFLIAWIAPDLLGPVWVKNLMLTMLIEFIVMHSGAFYAPLAAASGSPLARSLFLLGLTAFYGIFIAAFSFAFKSTWPLFAFGWLFLSRFAGLWMHNGNAQREFVSGVWIRSVIYYLLGVFATIFIPLPALGLTPEFVASMHLSGSGLWIDKPQTVIVFGALYFGALARFKFYLIDKAAPASIPTRNPV
jgi:hypothetical protein